MDRAARVSIAALVTGLGLSAAAGVAGGFDPGAPTRSVVAEGHWAMTGSDSDPDNESAAPTGSSDSDEENKKPDGSYSDAKGDDDLCTKEPCQPDNADIAGPEDNSEDDLSGR